MSAKVYFTREITPEKVLELYKLVGKDLNGKVAVKLHSGEKGNQNFHNDQGAGQIIPAARQMCSQKQGSGNQHQPDK